MTINTEGGLRPSRIEFVPEEGNQGVTPTDPEFQFPSMRCTNFEPELGPEEVEKFALGQVDADVEQGLEENEIMLEYDLQNWFVDSNGNPNDLAGYGMLRSAGVLPDSLTIVERMQSGDMDEGVYIRPESTVEYWYNDTDPANIDPKETRIYTVAKGCDVGELTLTCDIEEVDWHVEATLPSEDARSYQIDQPLADTELVVESTHSDDTNLEVHIEAEQTDTATEPTNEVIQLDGTDATAPQAGSTVFSDIDAIEVRDPNTGEVADHLGDILIHAADDTSVDPPTKGDLLSVLYGREFYGNTNGDHGVPTVGAGSRATEIADTYYKAANVSVERPAGKPFEAAGSVQSMELTVENEIERTPQQRSRSGRQHHGPRVAELSVTADGETISHQRLVERMAGDEIDTLVGFDQAGDETVNLRNAVVSESGRQREAGAPGAEQEFTLRATHPGLDVSSPSA